LRGKDRNAFIFTNMNEQKGRKGHMVLRQPPHTGSLRGRASGYIYFQLQIAGYEFRILQDSDPTDSIGAGACNG